MSLFFFLLTASFVGRLGWWSPLAVSCFFPPVAHLHGDAAISWLDPKRSCFAALSWAKSGKSQLKIRYTKRATASRPLRRVQCKPPPRKKRT